MNKITRRDAMAGLATSALLLQLPACASQPAARLTNSAHDVRALLDDIAYRLLSKQPERATSLGVDKGEHSALRSRLTDRSATGTQAIEQIVREDLARASSVDTSALDHETRTALEVVKSAYRTALEGFALPYGDVAVGEWRNSPYVVIQNVGAYLDIPRFLDSEHLVADATDAEAWLARLSLYPAVLDGELERIQHAREAGLVPPAFLLDKAIGQFSRSIESAQSGGSLVASIAARTRDVPGDWAARARQVTTAEVAPALERQLEELRRQRQSATDDPGMWARPHGEEYYRWALKASTTTTMTPDEVHRLGLEQIEILHARMHPILQSLGYSRGSVGERMQALANDSRYRFPEGDEGREEILAVIQESLAKIRQRLPQAFNTLMRGNLEVRRLPPEEEPGAPAAYGGPGSIDGTIPGKFWLNLRTTDLHSRYSLPDLAYHEAIPGHVWQGEYAQTLPLIQSVLAFNAYSEGWALYAEQLCDELGIYDDFPAGRLGYLQSIAFRACRLVVDTGLHAKRWSREQAVRFFVDVNGSNPLEVASEVDRYCSWPGQACGYEVGHHEINRLRSMAQTALGPRYDLRAFNDTLVLGGNVPLDVLALNVEDYIRRSPVE
ncbi:MAG: DUF885 domain-containing protein [Gammaproteobacteria bacterium]|nr:DUF885 domain-containing protein [Gammaproteobacteria bacterium]